MGKNQSKIDLPMEDDPNLPFKLGAPVIDIVEHVGKSYPEIEFEKLEQKSKIPPGSCSEAFREQNKEKNRYHLVVPYDSTRVKLNPIENEEFSDYINASWVNDNTYIATQGPLPQTIFDFWRMVWQYDVQIILMLTKILENGRMKCHKYWPEAEHETYKTFKIISQSVEEDDKNAITTRVLKIINLKTSEEREVIHYQYHGWPDHGVPSDTKGIRELLKRIEEKKKDSISPVVVHCSAGIGRTGTYCTVDAALKKAKKHIESNKTESLEYDLYNIVLQLRKQRNGMVQQPEQYKFCYETVIDGVEVMGVKLKEKSNNTDSPQEPREKPRRKKKVSTKETNQSNIEDENQVSGEKPKKHKKKKHHNKANGVEETDGQEKGETETLEQKVRKPKKHHKHHHKHHRKEKTTEETVTTPETVTTEETATTPEKVTTPEMVTTTETIKITEVKTDSPQN